MIGALQILAPSTADSGTSKMFDVELRPRVIFIAPSTGSSLTEDDAFQLSRVITVDANGNPDQVLPQYDSNGLITLGSGLRQFEVLLRGTYVIEKILATTESVGVYQNHGIEEGS